MNIGEFLKRLARYLAPSWRACLLISIGLLLEMGLTAIIPFSFKTIIDEALLQGKQQVLFMVVGGLVVGALVVSATGLGCDYLYARVVAAVLRDIRGRMFEHLQRLSMDFYSRAQAGDILARFSGDLAVVEQALTAAIPWGLLPALNVLASTVLLFALDWRLACVAMLVWPLCLLAPPLFARRAVQASYARKQEEGVTLTTVQENIATQAVVKGFSLEGMALRRFGSCNQRLSDSVLRLSFLNSLIERSAGVGALLLQVIVLAAGAWMASKGSMSIGTLASFQALFLGLSSALTYATQYVPTLVHATGGMQRVEELLGETPRVQEASQPVTLPPLSESIEVRDVSFSYTGDRPHLSEVSFRIRAGESVAFVGGSGSGKSTILNLLMRFHDPQQGSVLCDGVDLRRASMDSWRAQMGVVFQESLLFNTTIAENIRTGKLDATQAEIEEAARAAEIHDFIVTLPQGYDTPVGERGGRLSGGQRQRIAIARAMVRKPPILVLDEATSALDPQTEAAINATLSRLARNRTVLSVTHRLASVVHMDRIFVLERGRLVEHGPHQELLARNGFYHALWNKQHGFKFDDQSDTAGITPERLRDLPLFGGLQPELLSDMARQFSTEQYSAGREVIREGDPGDRFYVVVHGSLEVLRSMADASGQESQQRLAVLQDGDHFGEIALLRNQPRMANVRTLSHCVLLSLSRASFKDLMKRAPDVRAHIERMHVERESQNNLLEAVGLLS